MYEDRTQNYDPEIYEEYLIHPSYRHCDVMSRCSNKYQ